MNIKKLEKIAKKAREISIRISAKANAPHIGSASSIIEILTSIYFDVFNKELVPKNFSNQNKPYIILSKGHAVAALYAILYLKKYIDEREIYSYCADGGLPGHADTMVKGIDFSTGSLGHGIGVGVGIALSRKIENKKIPTIVIMGDGECQEGEVWEAANFASTKKIGNLIVIIDNNKWQGYDKTNVVGPNLKEKWKAFGWKVYEIDGHNIKIISQTIKKSFIENQPVVIIANTIKGKGLKELENKLESHYRSPKVEFHEEDNSKRN